MKQVKCEICSESYPLSIKYKGQEEFLFFTSFDESRKRIVFEVYEKNLVELKGMICLYTDGDQRKWSIGRAEKNQIKFNDVSVSRVHGYLIPSPKGLILKDNKSKFGTHLLLQRPIFPKLE